MFGVTGNAQLDGMELGAAYEARIESLRDAIRHYDREVMVLERRIHQQLRHDRFYNAIQTIPGVGPTIAATFWPRSVTCHGTPTRRHSPRGQGSRPNIASPTPK
jgi:transposase